MLAAKSIFRFGDLRQSDDKMRTEYVLLGTLFSFTLTIMLGLLVNKLLGVRGRRISPRSERRGGLEPLAEAADIETLHQLRDHAVADQRSGQPREVFPRQRLQANRAPSGENGM